MKIKLTTTAAALLLALTSTTAFAEPVQRDEFDARMKEIGDVTFDLDQNQQELWKTVYGELNDEGEVVNSGIIDALLDLDLQNARIVDVLSDLDLQKADKEVVEVVARAAAKLQETKADKSELATFQQKVETKLSQVGTMANFDSLKTDFAELQSTVNKLGTQVDVNTARLAQLDRRVSKVQKEVRNGLATQSALTGLFQPYNVGKVNVTAAVGGYKSSTALAVGTGYRFNENVAAKAGVAVSTNGGGLSYNVGVNYEF